MKPIEGMKKEPLGLNNPLMMGAFIVCVRWALGTKEIQKQFEDETGLSFSFLKKRSPLDIMIDRSTGRESEIIAKFADWVVVNIWGESE